MRYNHKRTQDAIDYIQSEKYGDSCLPFEVQVKKIAEKVVKGEIPLDAWQQLRADLEIKRIVNKKRNYLAGYG